MSFLSKIFKPIKKLFSAIGKVVKKVFKEAVRFAKSDLGKSLMTIAAVYFGAQALGMFGQGAASATTVPVLESQVAAVGAAGAEAGVTSSIAASSTANAATSIAGDLTASLTGGGSAATTAASSAFRMKGVEVASQKVLPTLMERALLAVSETGKWMQANPIPTIMAGKVLTSLGTQDPVDAEVELAKRLRRQTNIGGIDYGENYTGNPVIQTSILRQGLTDDLHTRTY